ncbi:glycosyltransferase [Oscillatoria sp. FACHB-1407]|uniref:glycosyltransferase n=1 Tax=Oscillatoria sp. FACHB-1407 TaxID=2692847 RepID=UPI0016825656|nr:glycosyltransferase [Oscillatoria sp. FACHB-1407]MBD2459693.1 glycosyltransferase [Oscillatoria sp. FACHB-1407]
MKVLFLTTVLPSHKLHGSEIASQNFIDGLKQTQKCDITVVGYSRKEDGELQHQPEEILVQQQYIETKKSGLYPMFWFALSLLKNIPYSSAKYISNKYIHTLKSLLAKHKYEVVIIDHAQLAWLRKFIKHPCKTVFIAHNIEHEIYQQHLQRSQRAIAKFVYGREATLIERMERDLARAVDVVWTLTQHDADYFSKFKQPAQVEVFNLPATSASFQHQVLDKQFDIGIIGSWTWKPNEEGLHWFLQEIYPHLPQTLSIHIAGRGADWLTDRYSNITYRGFVPDAQRFMAEARAVAIPILSGGGIQIKTLDAIASGSAIVATPMALRGISHPPKTVQIAQHPQEFAKCLEMTVTTSSTGLEAQRAIDDASAWYQDRREQFLAEISAQLESTH